MARTWKSHPTNSPHCKGRIPCHGSNRIGIESNWKSSFLFFYFLQSWMIWNNQKQFPFNSMLNSIIVLIDLVCFFHHPGKWNLYLKIFICDLRINIISLNIKTYLFTRIKSFVVKLPSYIINLPRWWMDVEMTLSARLNLYLHRS